MPIPLVASSFFSILNPFFGKITMSDSPLVGVNLQPICNTNGNNDDIYLKLKETKLFTQLSRI